MNSTPRSQNNLNLTVHRSVAAWLVMDHACDGLFTFKFKRHGTVAFRVTASCHSDVTANCRLHLSEIMHWILSSWSMTGGIKVFNIRQNNIDVYLSW